MEEEKKKKTNKAKIIAKGNITSQVHGGFGDNIRGNKIVGNSNISNVMVQSNNGNIDLENRKEKLSYRPIRPILTILTLLILLVIIGFLLYKIF